MSQDSTTDIRETPALRDFVDRLQRAAGDQLVSVVLYGSAARGDFYEEGQELNLMIVLADLTPATLRGLHAPLQRWLSGGQPMPRLFAPDIIADSADVFPIEFLDIAQHHVVLFGDDPLLGLDVHTDHLRLQCERELREKMMRLREAYIEAAGQAVRIKLLLAQSYTTFVNLFRGALRLHGDEVPAHDDEVAALFCQHSGLRHEPFHQVYRLKLGDKLKVELEALFESYYTQLEGAVRAIDRLDAHAGDTP